MPILLIHEPEGGPRAIHLKQDAFVIGRSRHATIRIADRTVSQRHALVSPTEGGYQISDLGSQNGVYVNERRMKLANLHDGDVVRLGRVRLTFLEGELGEEELSPEAIEVLLARRRASAPRAAPRPPSVRRSEQGAKPGAKAKGKPEAPPPRPGAPYRILVSLLRLVAVAVLAVGIGYYLGLGGRGETPGPPQAGGGPGPAPPAPAAPEAEETEPSLVEVPPPPPPIPGGDLARVFRTRVIPGLEGRCGSRACHGGVRGGAFVVEPGPTAGAGPLTRREGDLLLSLLGQFDPAQPDGSPLFRKAAGLEPHGGGIAVPAADPLLGDLRGFLMDARAEWLLRAEPPARPAEDSTRPVEARIALRERVLAALGRTPLPEEEARYLPMSEEDCARVLSGTPEARVYRWRRAVAGFAGALLDAVPVEKAATVRGLLAGATDRPPAADADIPTVLAERGILDAAGPGPVVEALFRHWLGRAPTDVERAEARKMAGGERAGVLGKRGRGLAKLVEILASSGPNRARIEPERPIPGRGPRDERAWARSLVVDLLGRLPTAGEEAAIIEAGRALPGGVVADLPVAYVVEAAAREAAPQPAVAARWVEHAFARFLLRAPTAEEREAFAACLAQGGGTREIRIALASSPEYRRLGTLPPDEERPEKAPCVVFVCAAGADGADLLSDPERFPSVRRLARSGALATDLRPASGRPRAAAAAALCGGEAAERGRPSLPTIFELLRRSTGEEAWLVAPRAIGWEALTCSTAEGYGEAFGAAFWPADGASHPALRRLVERFGRPEPLDSRGWARVRALRAALGSPVDALDVEVARAIAGPRPTGGAGRIGSFIEALLRERRPRLVVAVLMDTDVPPGDGEQYARGLAAIDGIVGRVARVLREDRGGGWVLLLSPCGRIHPSKGTGGKGGAGAGSAGRGFVLAAGGPFRVGRVVAKAHELRAIRATIARALGLASPGGDAGIDGMLRR